MDTRPWELAAAEVTRAQFVGNEGLTERWGRIVEKVDLDGVYPDTELVVTWRASSDGPATEARYHMWDEGFAEGGDRASPHDVAFLVRMDVDTSGDPLGSPRIVEPGWTPPDPAGAVRALENYQSARLGRS